MFVFDKKLDPAQAINFKPSSKAPFGYMGNLQLGGAVGACIADIFVSDPVVAVEKGGIAAAEVAGAVPTVAMLTKVHWNLGATDPIEIEGLITMQNKQILAGLLYAGLADISVTFGIRVFEYDPVPATAKKYYAALDTGIPPLIAKLLKDGERELSIELSDDEDLSIQDNSFYPFSIKLVPVKKGQPIVLASGSTGKITKMWGRTGAG